MPRSKFKKGATPVPPGTGQTVQPDDGAQVGDVIDGSYFLMKRDDDGLWHWMLFSKNGRALATDVKGYNQQNDCLSAIKKVCELADATKVLIAK